MNSILYSLLLLPFFVLLSFQATAAGPLGQEVSPNDTITIKIGKTKKIIIWVKDKKELESLQAYDINKMIADLSNTVDSLDSLKSPNHVLIITEENKSTYRMKVEVEIEVEKDSIDQDWYKPKAQQDTTKNKKDGNDGVHFNFSSKEKNHFGTTHHMEFDFGMNNYLNEAGEFPGSNDELYAVRPWGSWFVGINSNFRSRIAGPLAFQWGAGINWYNFKFENSDTRLEKTADGVAFVEAEDVYSIKSKLTATYLNVNLVPMLDFRYKSRKVTDQDGKTIRVRDYKDDSFRIGLGGYAGYRIGSHAKYKFDDDKLRKEKEHDRFYLNNWRYGVRLQLGIKGLDIFANYDLNNLFNPGKGPELHAISFGITI